MVWCQQRFERTSRYRCSAAAPLQCAIQRFGTKSTQKEEKKGKKKGKKDPNDAKNDDIEEPISDDKPCSC